MDHFSNPYIFVLQVVIFAGFFIKTDPKKGVKMPLAEGQNVKTKLAKNARISKSTQLQDQSGP